VAVLAIAFIIPGMGRFSIILLATGLMLTAEMLNSAIEALCDLLVSGTTKKSR